MPVKKLKEFLDGQKVKYVSISHSPAYTALEVAASAHVPGRELAKTVIIKVDGNMAMVVLPAASRVAFDLLAKQIGGKQVELAAEQEFQDRFPGCELGAMPPFGNLYGMEVFVSENLAAEDDLAFSAGSHSELIRLKYADFERLVKPKKVGISPSP
jgi:Ala-tRNA(Pro) deacylase